MTRPKVVVVGAGASGLSAARVLAVDHDVVVLDKGRGVGGRMATRRLDGATFDHGAQFVTTHSAAFAEVVGEWTAAGVVRPWYRGRVGPRGVDRDDGHVRHRGTVSMNAVAKHLAADLDVRTGRRVHALEAADGGWRVLHGPTDRAGAPPTMMAAEAVVLSAPVPQAIELLGTGGVELAHDDASALAAIEYAPCIAVMTVLDGPPGLPAPGALAPELDPIDWMADNQAKGISSVPALTVHLGERASRAWWDLPDAEVVQRTLTAAGEVAGRPLRPTGWSIQRWRYARPTVGHPARCLVPVAAPPMVLVGDAFGEAKVEGAVRSGIAGAAALRHRLAG